MQSAPALEPGSLISESARILELVFQDPFYIVYSGEATATGAKIGLTEYYPADLVARAPTGDVLLRSLELQDLFNLGRDRFIAEARALSALRHPALLRFDGVESDHGTVLALHAPEEGQSVTNFIKASKQPLPQETMDSVVKYLASALELMHSRNLIHANITPDTILLRPEPLLVRFGGTRCFLAARMRKVNLAVTPGYSAPELHFSDEKAHGPLCDIFSLAAVLYFFVTGRHPINVLARGMGHTMPPASSLPTQKFRPQFLEAIDRGLELEPEHRPQSMKAFAEMLLGTPEKKALEITQPAYQMAAGLAESPQVHAAPSAKPSAPPPSGSSSSSVKAAPKPPASIPPAEADDEDDEFEDAQGGFGMGKLLAFAAAVVLLVSAGLWLLEGQLRKQPEQSQLDAGKAAPSPAGPDRVAAPDQAPQTDYGERPATTRAPEESPVKPAPPEPETRAPALPQPGPQTRPSEPPARRPPASESVAPPSKAEESPAREPTGRAAGPAREPEVQKPEPRPIEAAPSPEPSAKRTPDFLPAEPAPSAKQTPATPVEQLPKRSGPGAITPPLSPEKPAVPKPEPAPSPLTEASVSSPAGYKFKDCDFCPPLVVVPNGEFTMGSNEHPHEKPAHKVRISRPFAIGQYEVTYAEWERCVQTGACRYRPEHQGSPDDAISNLSWDDAVTYVKWLSEKTGQVYRLPSEAEWEYAARAGSGKRFWWGDEAGSGNANCSDCQSGTNGQPSAVGSYKPNAFGLYDTAGNIAEWVQDCWNESYLGAPADGSAWMRGNCSLHGLRGGSYGNKATYVRSSSRFRYDSDVRYEANGFRVLRELR
jgi:formylglycine-generating enzyme required for sulfatase activity/serine/threonine protein kinase